MRMSSKSRWQLKLSQTIFVTLMLIVCGLIAYLSVRYNFYTDWTLNNRNSITETSEKLLLALDDAPTFTVYAAESSPARIIITNTVKQYQQVRPDIQLKYIDPELEPDLMRDLNLQSNNALQITVGGQSEFIPQLKEQNITNAIQRLARANDRWLVFIDGHGERKPNGVANHDLGEWGKQLAKKGIKYRSIRLSETPAIPINTAALVIASPQANYLPGEIELIENYLNAGGNLLWLTEPNTDFGLSSLATFLQLKLLPGAIHDRFTLARGINDPRFVIVSKHPKLSVNDNFQRDALFPFANAIEIQKNDQWQSMAILSSSSQSWLGSSSSPTQPSGELHSFDLGVALVRDIKLEADTTINKQRILVIGDGDFLSNMYQGNAGNIDLGLRFVNWVLYDDKFITIPVRSTPDIKLEFSETNKIIIGLGFLLVLPLLLGLIGARIWYVRRNR